MGLPDKETPTPAEPPVEESRAGRVVVDSRGRNVWQWARNAIDSTSILLKRLENTDLALEPTRKVPVIRGAESSKAPAGKPAAPPAKLNTQQPEGRTAQKGAKSADPARAIKRGGNGGGFDPYNSR